MLATVKRPVDESSTEQAFWTDVCLVKEIVHKTGIAVAQLEERMQKRTVSLEQNHQNHLERLMQITIRAWFDARYLLPDALSATSVWHVRIARGQLLDELNEFLQAIELPVVRKHDPIWRQWFLGTVLNLEESDRRSGKTVCLVRRWSPDRLRLLSEQTERYIQKQEMELS